MYIVREVDDKKAHAEIEARNALWLDSFLTQTIRLSVRPEVGDHTYFSGTLVRSLNFIATLNLSQEPGTLRDDFVHMTGSDHEPPHPDRVRDLFLDFIVKSNKKWVDEGPLEVAAYILWQINWLHPFVEGNGRTARAAAYYALCKKIGQVLPGRRNMMYFLRERERDYISALQAADRSLQMGTLDLSLLSKLINDTLVAQLRS